MKKITIVIIYDCPMNKCDKLWVKNELEKKGYRIKVVAPCLRISQVEQRGKLGRLLSRVFTFWQCIKAVCKSNPDDVVFCWSQWAGILLNCIPGVKKRMVISYNWLTPIKNEKTRNLYANAMNNTRFTIVINSPETKDKILQAYDTKDIGNIVYIPDVYDDTESFVSPIFNRSNRYCFTGGRANRDWHLIFEVARQCPELSFVAVAAAAEWDRTLLVPDNVLLKFDIPPGQYYKLMEKAFVSLYPLKDNRVSGLINILKSIQGGVPVVTTDTEATRIYFQKNATNCLLPFDDVSAWVKSVNEVYNLEEEKYCMHVAQMQNHIKKNFSPQMAADQIDKIICRNR